MQPRGLDRVDAALTVGNEGDPTKIQQQVQGGGRYAGAGVNQPGLDKQLPHTAQRGLQGLGQRLTRQQLSPAQGQQIALERQMQRFVLRRGQRRKQTQQPADQKPWHVSGP